MIHIPLILGRGAICIKIKKILKKYQHFRVCAISTCIGILIIFFKVLGTEAFIFGLYYGLSFLFFIIHIQYLSYKAGKGLKSIYCDLDGVLNYVNKNYKNLNIYRHPSNNSIAFFSIYFAIKKYDFKNDVVNNTLKQLRFEFIYIICLFSFSAPLFLYFVSI